MRRMRGFTLIELVLGAVLVLIIASVAMGVLIAVQRVQRDAQLRNAIARDAQFTLDTIVDDLKYLGAGVPRGQELYTAGQQYMRPPIRIGEDEYLAFVGDAPYPNADINGLATLLDVDEGHHIGLGDELSLCAPPIVAGAAYVCPTASRSLLDTGSLQNCDDAHRSAPTCPWGLGKYEGEDVGGVLPDGVHFAHLIWQAPSGRWVHREFESLHSDMPGPPTSAYGDKLVVPHFSHNYPSIGANPGNVAQNSAVTRSDFLGQRAGMPAVSQVDRIFYSFERNDGSACNGGDPVNGCVLRRRQCWGYASAMQPDDASFPAVGTASGNVRSNQPLGNIAACAAPGQGTAWEPIMSGITGLTFKYFSNPANPPLATPLNLDTSDDVTVIQVEVTMARQVPGANPASPSGTLVQTFTRRIFLENAGGRFTDNNGDGVNDVPAIQGGCTTKLTCGRDQ